MKLFQRIVSTVILFSIILSLSVFLAPFASAATKVSSQSNATLMYGVTESSITLNTGHKGNMLQVKPSAKAKLLTSYANYYTSGSTRASRKTKAASMPATNHQKTTAQAAAFEAATGRDVIFAVNANFWSLTTNQVRGAVIAEGNTIHKQASDAKYYFALLDTGKYVIRTYTQDDSDVVEAVAGKHLLVKNGTLQKDTTTQISARTCIGIKSDGTVVIFVVNGKTDSSGITIQAAAEVMHSLGCVDAINLDGGGSTTFATQRKGETTLKIRNSPSDSTGERAVSSALLLVPDPACDRMLFDFTNNADAKTRYGTNLYGGLNYDTGGWHYNSNHTSAPVFDATAGTMTFKKKAYNEERTIHTVITSSNSSYSSGHPLTYIPSENDYVSVRLKITGSPDTSAGFRLKYACDDSDSSEKVAFSKSISASDINSGFFTLTGKVNSTFASYDSIKAIRPEVYNLTMPANKTGLTITIDYIYVGPLPSERIWINFKNYSSDKRRYTTKTYNGNNFDTGNWVIRGVDDAMTDLTFDNSAGTLSAKLNNNDKGHYYFHTGKGHCFWYNMKTTDYIQICMKLDNMISPAAKSTFRVTVSLVLDPHTSVEETNLRRSVDFPISLINKGYFYVTIPASEFISSTQVLKAMRIGFTGVTSASGKTGVFTLDNLFVGPKSALPSGLHTVSFYNGDGTLLQKQSVAPNDPVSYSGSTATKAPDAQSHYSFTGWVDATGKTPDLNKITSDLSLYPVFAGEDHGQELQNVKEPTCSQQGYTGDLCCPTCSYVLEAGTAIETAAHTPELRNAKDSTCSEQGYSGDLYCSVCDALLEIGTATDIADHSYNDGQIIVESNCLQQGQKLYTCTTCGETKTETLPFGEHRIQVIPGTAPDCLSSGMTEGRFCSTCHEIFAQQEIVPRLGHDYNYSDNGDGTHTGACSRCNKTVSEEHKFAEGICVCGAQEVLAPTVDEQITIGHTLNLASDISVNFAISTASLADYDSYYLECTLYDGTVAEIKPVLNGSYYYFTLAGLTAVNMNDEIRATLHMTKDGRDFISQEERYSIAQYAYSQLNKTGISESLKTLCADLLRYGAAAQIFKGYRTDSLADAAMTESHKTYLSDLEAVTFGNTNVTLSDLESPAIIWIGKTLNLESKVTLKFVFSTANYTGNLKDLSFRVSYTDIEGNTITTTIDEIEPYNAANGQYAFSFDGLLAAELRSVVSVQVTAGDVPVSCTLQYSADTYGNNKTGTLGTLCRALMAYSDSANKYFV